MHLWAYIQIFARRIEFRRESVMSSLMIWHLLKAVFFKGFHMRFVVGQSDFLLVKIVFHFYIQNKKLVISIR